MAASGSSRCASRTAAPSMPDVLTMPHGASRVRLSSLVATIWTNCSACAGTSGQPNRPVTSIRRGVGGEAGLSRAVNHR